MPAGINAYINYTRAYANFAMRIFAGIDVPNNAGIERVIRTVAREGSFFNPRYPAAGGGRASLQVRIFDTINGAMAQAVPERAMGAFTHWANPKIGGVDPATGKRWIMYDLILGGFGGRSYKDGAEALCPVFNCANVPVEVHETNNPVRIHRLELIPDSGGAGRVPRRLRHSQGCRDPRRRRHRRSARRSAQERAVRPVRRAVRRARPDRPAARRRGMRPRLERGAAAWNAATSSASAWPAPAATAIPHARDPQAVQADITDGLVSPASATAAYGTKLA